MDFAAIAHDLRSPLNVMLGHMQMLAAEGISEVSRRRLEILDRQIHRMIRLLDSCGKQPYQLPSFSAVDLNTTIRNAIAEFEVIFARRGIQIVLTVDKPLPLVVGDADLLHRVLVNVLTNAADSITAGGRIEIGALAEKLPNMSVTTVYVQIRDSGSGIPVDVIPRVFDDGFTTKRNGEGHGLGLGICREIVQRHGGRIELSSALGKGTTVCLSLPARL